MHNDIPEAMQTFLNELYLTITHKRGEDAWFDFQTGICGNWSHYCSYHGTGKALYARGVDWLGAQFCGMAYPFDNDVAIAYINDRRKGTLYKNPFRIAFIERHVTV